MLVNSGFEHDTGWTLPSTTYAADYSTTRAYAGTRSLRVGIPTGGTNIYSYSSGSQWGDLLADAATLTLYAQVWRGSSTAGAEGDTQYLWVRTADDTTYTVFHGYSNARVWQSIEYDLTALAGERVQIYLGTYNNGVGGTTVMYADEVTVESCDS